MKKFLVALLAVGLLLSLCACDLEFLLPDFLDLGWGDFAETSASVETLMPTIQETQPERMHNVLLPGPDFQMRIPQYIEKISFVYASVPTDVELMDLSADGDGSMVGWITKDTREMTVTTADGGVLRANDNSAYMFDEKIQLLEFQLLP